MTSEKQPRIKSACLELEKAIEFFEDESQGHAKAKVEAEKLKQLKKTLSDIKKQLEDLSE